MRDALENTGKGFSVIDNWWDEHWFLAIGIICVVWVLVIVIFDMFKRDHRREE